MPFISTLTSKRKSRVSNPDLKVNILKVKFCEFGSLIDKEVPSLLVRMKTNT